MASAPSEDDIAYHLVESIETWRDPLDGSYWSVSRLVADSSLEFTIRSEDGDAIQTFTLTVREN